MSDIFHNPEYCQYESGQCSVDFTKLKQKRGFCIYPSNPPQFSDTIESAISLLKRKDPSWFSWTTLPIGGKIIFCEICKAIREAEVVVADITTFNLNVMFEIGFSIGLHKPIRLIRDPSYEKDKKSFERIGLLDTIGYDSYQSSEDICEFLSKDDQKMPVILKSKDINKQQPVFYVKSPVDNDASIKIGSMLKKSHLRFRSFDARETSRISLIDAYHEVKSSVGVISHLIAEERRDSLVHNARCAFISGIAMASGKYVCMIKEAFEAEPIDYRDVMKHYERTSQVETPVENFNKSIFLSLQGEVESFKQTYLSLLEEIDLGDLAAENEILALRRYFIKTPQYLQARQGHARIIVGRKGSGKTAIFYSLRNHFVKNKNNLVVDLKPEGHQLVKLKTQILVKLDRGVQLHTLTAFWEYLLLLELINKVLYTEQDAAYQNHESLERYKNLEDLYYRHVDRGVLDFSERLNKLVETVADRFAALKCEIITQKVLTESIFQVDIVELLNSLEDFLISKECVWILIDNLDKGWSDLGAEKEDIAIIRCLLDASRKLERQFLRLDVKLHFVIFVRRDIYDLLIAQTSDRGKEAVANLDWADTKLMKELIGNRLRLKGKLEGEFDDVWRSITDTHVDGVDSFMYMVGRGFRRPRDLLNFLRKALQLTISRGNQRIDEEDIKDAENAYSEDMFNDLYFEIHDIHPSFSEVLYQFLNSKRILSYEDLFFIFINQNLPEEEFEKLLDLLLWFCFLGVVAGHEELFAYDASYNLKKLKAHLTGVSDTDPVYAIHPAFYRAIEVK